MTDLTLSELRKYNGVDDEHILFALNGTVGFYLVMSYDFCRYMMFLGDELFMDRVVATEILLDVMLRAL